MSTEAELNALASIGLSQYEGKCFLAALETGPATINQIGIVAGVPRTKVYGAVRKLAERGLFEQSKEDDRIYSAKSPREVLIPLLEKEEKRIKQGLEALTRLEIIHQSMAYVKRTDALSSNTLRISPRSAVTKKFQELLFQSRKRIVIFTTANGLVRLSKMSGLLFERAEAGAEIEVMTPIKDEPVFHTAIQSINEIENSKVSLLTSPGSSFPLQIAVIDGKYAIFCEFKPDDMRDEAMDVAFVIENSELAEMAEALIRSLAGTQRSTSADKVISK